MIRKISDRKKKLLIKLSLISLILAIYSCSRIIIPPVINPVITIEAQTLPITKTLAWDAGTNADNYTVKLDGVVVGTVTTLTEPFTITTLGVHVLTVTSNNTWGSSSPATLNINVVLPTVTANLRIQ